MASAQPVPAPTPEQLVSGFEALWDTWMKPLLDSDGDELQVSRVTRLLLNIGLLPSAEQDYDLAQLQVEHVTQKFQNYCSQLTALWNSWRSAKLDEVDSGLQDETARLRRMADFVWYCWVELYASMRCNAIENGQQLNQLPPQLLSLRFTPMIALNVETLNPFQQTLLFMLDKLCDLNYRRYNSDCYEQVRVNGVGTHAWRRVMGIDEFVYQAVTKELHAEMWQNFTQSANIAKQLIEQLKVSYDPQFPPLHKTRGVISFSNGVYICKLGDQFDQWYPYEENGYGQSVYDLPADLVACNFINAPFNPYKTHKSQPSVSFPDVPTPVLQSIFDYQQLQFDVCGWIFALLGRFLYKLNDMESWQVILFFKGVAGSGKSTLCKMAANFYEDGDVGILSNKIEAQFGLSQFIGKMGFVAPELKRDLQLDQADFQTMISGEGMTVAQKFKDPRSIVWEVPGILGGNEVPNWTDNSGSISRRLMVVHFPKKVQNGDSKLAQKLKAELPAIILKCNLAYLDAVVEHGEHSVWDYVPDYFKQTQRVMAESCNALVAFLGSDQIQLGPALYCSERDFKTKLQAFMRDSNYNAAYRWEADFYRAIFDDHNLQIQSDERIYPIGSDTQKRLRFILGCGIASAQQ